MVERQISATKCRTKGTQQVTTSHMTGESRLVKVVDSVDSVDEAMRIRPIRGKNGLYARATHVFVFYVLPSASRFRKTLASPVARSAQREGECYVAGQFGPASIGFP